MKVTHSMVLVLIDEGGEPNVLYASPDANVHVTRTLVHAFSGIDGKTIPVEVYENLSREDEKALRREVNTRRNGDKRERLIGG